MIISDQGLKLTFISPAFPVVIVKVHKLRTCSTANNKKRFLFCCALLCFLGFFFFNSGQVPLRRLQYSVLNGKNLRLLREVIGKRNFGWNCKRQQITDAILKRPHLSQWTMLKSSYGAKKIELQRTTSCHKYIHGIWAKFLTSDYAMP